MVKIFLKYRPLLLLFLFCFGEWVRNYFIFIVLLFTFGWYWCLLRATALWELLTPFGCCQLLGAFALCLMLPFCEFHLLGADNTLLVLLLFGYCFPLGAASLWVLLPFGCCCSRDSGPFGFYCFLMLPFVGSPIIWVLPIESYSPMGAAVTLSELQLFGCCHL